MSDSKIILAPNDEQFKSFILVQQALLKSLETFVDEKVETFKNNSTEHKFVGLSQLAMLSKEREWSDKIGMWSSVSISSQDFQGFYFTFGFGETNLCYIFTNFQECFDGIDSQNGIITFTINQHSGSDDIYHLLISVLKDFGLVYTVDIDKTITLI